MTFQILKQKPKFYPLSTLIILTIILTLGIWIGSKWYYQDWFVDWEKYVAKSASLTATILISWTILLSTRLKIFEKLAGGLDKIYQIHKHIGMWALELVLLHPLFLALRYLPNWQYFLEFFWFQDWGYEYNVGHNIGIIILVGMFTLVLLTINTKLPYQLWKKLHELFGLFYFLIIGHIYLVDADIAEYPLLHVWMYTWLGLTVLAYLYIRFGYNVIGPKYPYEVESIEFTGDITEITLTPKKYKLDYRPSQWAYIQIFNENIPTELHPFSIASSPNPDGKVKFGIKKLGDFTKTLVNLRVGDRVNLYGPYGKFSEKFLKGDKDCVFVGGGIGITPFFGMWDMAINSLDRHQAPGQLHALPFTNWHSPHVHLIYSVNFENEASFDNDIQQSVIRSQYYGQEKYMERLHTYELFVASKKGYLTADYIEQQVGSLTDKYIFLCGPGPMINSLITQLKAKGVKNSQIITENFALLQGNPSLLHKGYTYLRKKLPLLLRKVAKK